MAEERYFNSAHVEEGKLLSDRPGVTGQLEQDIYDALIPILTKYNKKHLSKKR